MKKGVLLSLAMFLIFLTPVASAQKLDRPNNKFGISLLQPSDDDIKKTAELVNSNGGDYGYVTLVIQENDRDRRKWQDLFEKLRENNLIPIIRLATQLEGENWRKPEEKDAEEWVNFLDSLNWIIKDRYVVLFNEVNHGQEWGGETNPDEYAKVADIFAKKLKEKNKDFFVMLAGLDLSAPSSYPNYESADSFYRSIIDIQISIFNNLDGLVSHSYPNPGFAGSPWDTGRRSIRGYEWELELLKENGIEKELPVFITETGWENKCQMSNVKCQNGEEERIASNYKVAYEKIWGMDERVVAVTPFVFSYQSPPFLGFSWKVPGDGFYSQYNTVKELSKQNGDPEITENGLLEIPLSIDLVANSSYRFKIPLKNTGQGFWDKEKGYELQFQNPNKLPFDYFFSDIVKIKPGEDMELSLTVKTQKPAAQFNTKVVLVKKGKTIIQTKEMNIIIDPLPSLNFKASLFPKLKSTGEDFELQLFDSDETLVFKKKGIWVRDGNGIVDQVQNIALGKKYRIVLLKPYYLPRQTFIIFKKGQNEFMFKKMYPLDFSKDGKLDWGDVGELLKKPALLFNLIP
ncbi:hypothetical protein COY87_01075 [Candidatus Roizmanbacteria bacterium CG_4_10_14_0_8_um_filter_33_9]|uniref:Glycoside hydrolase family 5 domain-containing protein n=1 Tax=Candidatus Roizmanbacteria bacterium CG_4_10_14_0_8_um_filter_33_9 TaxID=1974826 RepID=A0A2M7QK75_9BACT|nr:MAG: hypothetical protein COY87_01075 [Candidatus Roizmanbacteria bacterium CG_4_10_14_0_8_um_filter_33_9]